MSNESSWTFQPPPEILPPEVAEAVMLLLWSVIPCNLYKRPLFKWKAQQFSAATIEEVRIWAGIRPASWAVVTGEISNIVAFDFDSEAGARTMHELGLRAHVQTGSGFFHVYIEHPGFRVPTLNTKAAPALERLLPGCDIKGEGGYAIFCGRNKKGPYRSLRSLNPDRCTPELRELLSQIASLKRAGARKGQSSGQPHVDEIAAEDEIRLDDSGSGHAVPAAVLLRWALRRSASGRNNAGFDLACQLRDNGYSEDEALGVMAAYSAGVGHTDQKGYAEAYTDAEAIASLRQAFSRPSRAPWTQAYPSMSGCAPSGDEDPADLNTDRAPNGEDVDSLKSEAGDNSPPPQPPFGLRLVSPDGPRNRAFPWVIVNNRPLHQISTEALAALRLSNQAAPYLFMRGARVVEVIADEQGQTSLRLVDETAMRGFLSRAADFVRLTDTVAHVFPPIAVARDILKRTPRELDLPPLISIVEAPQIDEAGRVLLTPGYDPATGLFYAPAPDLRDLRLPISPREPEVRWAKELILDNFLGEFCFADDASKANAVGELVTSIVRPAFSGPVPALAINAVTPNSGKTLLAGVISLIATGHIDKLTTAPNPNEAGEFRKKITTYLLEGATIIIIDNVTGVLDSADLAALLTSPKFSDRILGGNTSITIKPTCRWIITGNQLRFSTDNRRRCYTIMLDPKCPDPQNRKFKYPDLECWTTTNRRDLITALLILITHAFANGRPQSASVPRMSNFSPWASLVGGILGSADINGFLLNNSETYAGDLESEEWEAFLLPISEVTYGKSFTVSELTDTLNEKTWDPERRVTEQSKNAKTLRGAMPGNLQSRLDRPDSLPHVIGNALGAIAGRYFGESAVHVIDTREKRHHSVVWQIVIPNPGAASKQEPPTSRDGTGNDGASAPRRPLSDFF
jgi:hypothetical protein